MRMKNTLVSLLAATVCTAAPVTTELPSTLAELRKGGAFGFPQAQAKVLCDSSSLRFSVWNNQEYLFAQAVLWTDDDSCLGKSEENREIGDWSELMLDLDADGKSTREVDRDYMLNPWPSMSGLQYQVRRPAL